MAMTLAQTAIFTKRLMVIFVIVLLLSLSGWLGYRYWYFNIYLPNLPVVEEKPDLKFGKLPKLNLPTNSLSSSNYSYSIDTATGKFEGNFPKLIKVYFIPKLGITLLTQNTTDKLASNLGFDEEPEKISPEQYRYINKDGGQLAIDLDTGNFKFRRYPATFSATLNSKSTFTLPDQSKLVSDFKDFLLRLELLKDQLISGGSIVEYDNDLQTESNTATIYLSQIEVDGLKILTPFFDKGIIKTVVSKAEGDEKYISLDYIYWPPDLNIYGTYPIKTVEQAFEQLQKGNAVVIKEPKKNQVSLLSASLTYFISEDYPTYLQSLYLFEGEDFAAITPALEDVYISE